MAPRVVLEMSATGPCRPSRRDSLASLEALSPKGCGSGGARGGKSEAKAPVAGAPPKLLPPRLSSEKRPMPLAGELSADATRTETKHIESA
jgi:hypothetical protein